VNHILGKSSNKFFWTFTFFYRRFCINHTRNANNKFVHEACRNGLIVSFNCVMSQTRNRRLAIIGISNLSQVFMLSFQLGSKLVMSKNKYNFLQYNFENTTLNTIHRWIQLWNYLKPCNKLIIRHQLKSLFLIHSVALVKLFTGYNYKCNPFTRKGLKCGKFPCNLLRPGSKHNIYIYDMLFRWIR